jgi:hypothetical protein
MTVQTRSTATAQGHIAESLAMCMNSCHGPCPPVRMLTLKICATMEREAVDVRPFLRYLLAPTNLKRFTLSGFRDEDMSTFFDMAKG